MGKILAIDYGKKRTGLAITDSLQMIASPLDTVSTYDLQAYLENLLNKERIDILVIGEPKNLQNEAETIEKSILPLINFIKRRFTQLKIERIDERFTSKIALQTMIAGGMPKKERRKKENLDKLSATIILQSYLENREFKSTL